MKSSVVKHIAQISTRIVTICMSLGLANYHSVVLTSLQNQECMYGQSSSFLLYPGLWIRGKYTVVIKIIVHGTSHRNSKWLQHWQNLYMYLLFICQLCDKIS